MKEKSPEMKKEQVFLSGGHQICLIVKGNKTWDEYYKDNKKHDKSWNIDGKILEQFEKKYKIEFQYCKSNEEISFLNLKPSLWQKIRMMISRG